MYGIFANMCPTNHPNVAKYAIHGAYGIVHGVDQPTHIAFGPTFYPKGG